MKNFSGTRFIFDRHKHMIQRHKTCDFLSFTYQKVWIASTTETPPKLELYCVEHKIMRKVLVL